LDGGCERVGLVLTKPKAHWRRYQEAVAEGLNPDEVGLVSYLAPEDLPDFIAGNAPGGEARETVVAGYKVRVSRTDQSVAGTEARRQAIAQIIATRSDR
jgi:hypothetical protein